MSYISNWRPLCNVLNPTAHAAVATAGSSNNATAVMLLVMWCEMAENKLVTRFVYIMCKMHWYETFFRDYKTEKEARGDI